MQMPIIVEDNLEHDIEVEGDQSPAQEAFLTLASLVNNRGIRHVNAVEETKVDMKEWHILRLSKTSAKCC